MPSVNHLLIIDPQNDFCDLPASYLPVKLPYSRETQQPALPVPGSHEDMRRLALFIDAAADKLDAITVTLDSHHKVGIERPAFWKVSADGSEPKPFSQITAADVKAGKVEPRNPDWRGRVLMYLDALEAAGRYTHTVWPAHCELGSWGHNVHVDVRHAYNRWEERRGVAVNTVIKGANPFTEHYSAICAEVPDPSDPDTQINTRLLGRLADADRIIIAGEASSHCVRATALHLMQQLGAGFAAKMILLTDCMSPVTGFGPDYEEFLADAQHQGVQALTSVEVISAATLSLEHRSAYS